DKLADADKTDIWDKIKEGVALKDVIEQTEALVVPISSEVILNKQKTRKGLWTFAKYAAILLFSFGLGLLWVFFGQKQEEQQAKVVANWQKHETPLGVKSTITLSDGSVVTLNSGSRISYMENFTGPEREVFLEGE